MDAEFTFDSSELLEAETSFDESLRERVTRYLVEHDCFVKRELRSLFELDAWKDREFGLFLHSITDVLARTGRVFVSRDGAYIVASPMGISRRAHTFEKTAIAKIERAVMLNRVAAETAEDPDEKRRLQRRALRRANRVVDTKNDFAASKKAKPKGL